MDVFDFDFPIDHKLERELSLWGDAQCYQYYVDVRRTHCTFRQLLDLSIVAPYCQGCTESAPFYSPRLPDISPVSWKQDVAWCVGEDALRDIQEAIRGDSDFAWLCKGCGRALQPWECNGDEVYASEYYLEDHFRFPLEWARKRPSPKVSERIKELYDQKCFGCAAEGVELQIDHIFPRSKGGTTAFRNLQPLCQDCGQKKGDSLPEEVAVIDSMFFEPYPSDGYEGFF